MLITERVLRRLVRHILLEGMEEDAAALERRLDLGAFGPDSRKSFNDINTNRKQRQKFIKWLGDRYLRGTFPVTDTLDDALPSVADYAAAVDSINQKYNAGADFKAAVDTAYDPASRGWNSPADIAKMDLSVFVTLLALHERKKQTHSADLDIEKYQADKVGQFGPWALYFPRSQKSSIAIAGADPLTLRGYTTWCTARTAGSNLFYNYAAGGVMLFYAIDTSVTSVPVDEPGFRPESRISLGFTGGKLNADGNHGGVTVDAKNDGLKDPDLRRVFGAHYDSILGAAESVVKQHSGAHPAKSEIAAAAQDLTKLKQITHGLSEEEEDDLLTHIFDHPISREVAVYCASHSNATIRIQVAENLNTPPDVLVKLSRDDHPGVRHAIAENHKTPPETLAMLSNDVDACEYIAKNPSTPQHILTKLSKIPDSFIHMSLAKNLNTPPEILVMLSRNGGMWVRKFIAENPNTPTDVLVKLSRDAETHVRYEVAMNPSTPPDVLEWLSEDQLTGARGVAQNHSAPADVLAQLSENRQAEVRVHVAKNPNTPTDVLEHLSRDASARVRFYVANNPNTPLAALAQLSLEKGNEMSVRVEKNPTWKSLPEEKRAALVAAAREAGRSRAVAESIVRKLRRI